MSPHEQAARLARLERERAELAASLPKHSVSAAVLIRLEDLDDEITALRAAARPTTADGAATPQENAGWPPGRP